jgi:hypothetical protein
MVRVVKMKRYGPVVDLVPTQMKWVMHDGPMVMGYWGRHSLLRIMQEIAMAKPKQKPKPRPGDDGFVPSK